MELFQSETITHFAEVILPLPLAKNYSFGIPAEWVDTLTPGQRVIVQFGKKKIYTALVYRITSVAPSYPTKPILEVLDIQPVVSANAFGMWRWIADYYCCTMGEVMQAALPAGLKLASETIIKLHPAYQEDQFPLDDDQYLIAEALTLQEKLTIGEIQNILGKKSVYPVIQDLQRKKVVISSEDLQEKYVEKKETHLRLHKEYEGKQKRKKLFEELEKAPKQLECLMYFLEKSRKTSHYPKKKLARQLGSGYGIIRALVKKNILVEEEVTVSRITDVNPAQFQDIVLSDTQKKAFNQIETVLKEKNVGLLHGVTSSGKTEIYAELIKQYIRQGKQVLYLLPEIALTAQIITRMRKLFGERIGIYHSRFNTMERVEIWKKALEGHYDIILAPRSGIFLPLDNLGLIIVDEEHDNSYKQFDPAPRYHARDVAIWRTVAQKELRVLLGSATPSLESYVNALKGKYGLVKLNERYGGIAPPEIEIVDHRKVIHSKDFKSIFTARLLEKIKQTLVAGKQVILFKNRRGYAPVLQCGTCGFIPVCKNCDVSLTYHKFQNELICHLCNYKEKVPGTCKACGNHDMQVVGFGTEKIEDELGAFLPEARIARMDQDTIRGKYGAEKLIRNFEKGHIDVLIGTQMVTKGLDFDKVGLVGILSADQLLRYPDFRAHERAFQLMQQVSGRAGRRKETGHVIIQAYEMQHPILDFVKLADYKGFAQWEMAERKRFGYPPWLRIIQLEIRHRDRKTTEHAAHTLHKMLRQSLGTWVYPPAQPHIIRIRNHYRMHVLIKLPLDNKAIANAKSTVQEAIDNLNLMKDYKQVRVVADIDPY